MAERRKKDEAELEERRKKGIMSGREIFSQVREVDYVPEAYTSAVVHSLSHRAQ